MTFAEWWKSVAAHRMTWSRRMAAEYAWDAARADIEAVLVSKHGGEPLSLLAELDACRDLSRTLKRENATLRNAQKACEDCDAPTAAEVAELRAQLATSQRDCADAERIARQHIEDAPHAEYCGSPSSAGSQVYECRCWKAEALAALDSAMRAEGLKA